MTTCCSHPLCLFHVVLREFEVVEQTKEHLEQVFPPVRMKRIAEGFDDLEKHGQRSRKSYNKKFISIINTIYKEIHFETDIHLFTWCEHRAYND